MACLAFYVSRCFFLGCGIVLKETVVVSLFPRAYAQMWVAIAASWAGWLAHALILEAGHGGGPGAVVGIRGPIQMGGGSVPPLSVCRVLLDVMQQ